MNRLSDAEIQVLLSSMTPQMCALPAAICAATSPATSGWRAGSFALLPWLQSISRRGASCAACSASDARATLASAATGIRRSPSTRATSAAWRSGFLIVIAISSGSLSILAVSS